MLSLGDGRHVTRGRLLFPLADGWALGADKNQWMLLRARYWHAQVVWQPLAFVGSTKTLLLLRMAENGIEVTPDAQAKLDRLPEKFLEFRRQQAFQSDNSAVGGLHRAKQRRSTAKSKRTARSVHSGEPS